MRFILFWVLFSLSGFFIRYISDIDLSGWWIVGIAFVITFVIRFFEALSKSDSYSSSSRKRNDNDSVFASTFFGGCGGDSSCGGSGSSSCGGGGCGGS